MIIWVDAHLSPSIATWITQTFSIIALVLRDVGLRDAEDEDIFEAAKAQGVIFITKNRDFIDLVDRLETPPPQVIWLTCGNTYNATVREILSANLLEALEILSSGEALVEITLVRCQRTLLNLNIIEVTY